jgi:hypothetical protein
LFFLEGEDKQTILVGRIALPEPNSLFVAITEGSSKDTGERRLRFVLDKQV